jgi:hypothetical protein
MKNMKDAALAALAFFKPKDSTWNVQTDMNQDAIVNTYDVADTARGSDTIIRSLRTLLYAYT